MSDLDYNPRSKDLVGQVFTRLTAIERLPEKGKAAKWRCVCECGNTTYVIGIELTSGRSKSCGCLRKELATKHGMRYSPEYTAHCRMWERCTNVNSPDYPAYRHRTPPESWRDFEVFFAEVGSRPSPEFSLDRIRNEEPYGPGNVRWTTKGVQANNRSSNLYLTYQGVTHTMAEWAYILKVPPNTLSKRLQRGWTVEKALSTP